MHICVKYPMMINLKTLFEKYKNFRGPEFPRSCRLHFVYLDRSILKTFILFWFYKVFYVLKTIILSIAKKV